MIHIYNRFIEKSNFIKEISNNNNNNIIKIKYYIKNLDVFIMLKKFKLFHRKTTVRI